MNKNWNEMDEHELEEALSTSTVNGLSKKAVSKRAKKYGQNVIFRLPHGSFSSYFKDIASDSSAIIMVLAAIICSIFKSTFAAYIIVGLILINCIVCVFTYVKANRVLEGLGEYSLPGCKVIRDGHLYLMKMTALVPGDLIYLKSGDIVPADARIISCEGFYVSEKGITGNNSAMRKGPKSLTPDNNKPERMQNMIFASSVVLKGNARAVVVETGDNTLAVRTKTNSIETPDHSLEVFELLKKYSIIMSIIMLGIAALIMFAEIMIGVRGLYDIFLGAMALSVAAMTEFYLAFGYMIVACGLFGASVTTSRNKSSVILKNIKSVDRLKNINCVILRREGVLSEKNKQVDMIYTKDTVYETSKCDTANGFKALLEAAVVTTGQYTQKSVSNGGLSQNIKSDDRAILDAAVKYGIYNIELDNKYKLVMHTEAGKTSPFDVSVVEVNGELYAFVKGNADAVLNASTRYDIGGGMDIPIDSAIRVNLSEVIGAYSKSNGSVFAVCVCKTTENLMMSGVGNILRSGAKMLGIFSTRAPMYDECALTVEKLKNAGIKIILNSPHGFNDDINCAKNLGILKENDRILTESILETITDEKLRSSLDSYTVYIGLTNASLRRLVNLLKEVSNVAFCANTLSDITVMECADIGYAQTAVPDRHSIKNKACFNTEDDCDALRYKADVVIPGNARGKRGGINALANSILTSKLIYKNIMNMLAYLITVQFARLFVILYSVFSASDTLTPMQVLAGGMIFDLLAVISIAFSSADVRTYDDFEYTKRDLSSLRYFYIRHAMFGVFWAAVSVVVPLIASSIGAMLPSAFSSCIFISFTLLQFTVLVEIKRYQSIFKLGSVRINRFYIFSLLVVILFFAVCFIFDDFGLLFSVCPSARASIISNIITVASVISIFELYKVLMLREKSEKTKK